MNEEELEKSKDCEHEFGPPEFSKWDLTVYDELWCNETCVKCGYTTPLRFII